MENIILKEIRLSFENNNESKDAINSICNDRELVSIMVGYFIALGDLDIKINEQE